MKKIIKTITPFELAQEQVKNNTLKTPLVITGNGEIDYFGYQLATHHFNMKLMATGMKFRGITFMQLKNYYGLKGRSAKDCLAQFEDIFNAYKAKLALVNSLGRN